MPILVEVGSGEVGLCGFLWIADRDEDDRELLMFNGEEIFGLCLGRLALSGIWKDWYRVDVTGWQLVYTRLLSDCSLMQSLAQMSRRVP